MLFVGLRAWFDVVRVDYGLALVAPSCLRAPRSGGAGVSTSSAATFEGSGNSYIFHFMLLVRGILLFKRRLTKGPRRQDKIIRRGTADKLACEQPKTLLYNSPATPTLRHARSHVEY